MKHKACSWVLECGDNIPFNSTIFTTQVLFNVLKNNQLKTGNIK